MCTTHEAHKMLNPWVGISVATTGLDGRALSRQPPPWIRQKHLSTQVGIKASSISEKNGISTRQNCLY